jgi:hypothetical protein
MNENKTTIDSVKDRQSADAEFWRIPTVERFTGLKRGHVYKLINAGAIKSVVLRKKGSKTGVRLIHVKSLRNYLHSMMDATSR